MTQEELKRINRLNRDIRDYEDIVKSKDIVISIGSFSEDERQALYTFMEQRCAILRATFAALKVPEELKDGWGIKISSDGDKTTAKLYENGNAVREAT